MGEDQKTQLQNKLWNIADILRGKMSADEYRDYILGFIFYKYLSERMEVFANKILSEDKINFRDIEEAMPDYDAFIAAIKEEALEKLGYFLLPNQLFGKLAARGKTLAEDKSEYKIEDLEEAKKQPYFILENVQIILKHIQDSTLGAESQEDFNNLFEDMDLNSSKLGKTPVERNAVIASIFTELDKIDFQLENLEIDVLGDAYEYLIGQFASGAGKKAGEFYTPQEVSKILAKIVTTGKKQLKTVYDPTCGSGSLLLRVAKDATVGTFYGQELNRTTYNLARMNMIMHGVHYRNFDIKQDDTLERPQHRGLKFDAIVANPPFSANWSAKPLFMSDDRFSEYGKLAPSSKADYAFVQHMLAHLADNGTMAVVLPHGVLFRGGAEGQIRQHILHESRNYLDAVIGLPANIFYGTSIPTAILVFKKCRENPNDVLFIDASQEFDKVKTQNILREHHIDKIIATYRNRSETAKFSKKISLSEIAKNDFNLNIPRYVDTFEAEESINIDAIAEQIAGLDAKMKKADAEIADFCAQLGIKTPF
jgi:type I restriction enzyme M protein